MSDFKCNNLPWPHLHLASEAYLSRLNSMKPTLVALLAFCLCLGGCGKKEPVQPSASNTEATKPEKETGKEATQPTNPEPTKVKAAAGAKLWISVSP